AGVALALLYNLILPLHANFTYPFEYNYYQKASNENNILKKTNLLQEWLYYAPSNLYAFKSLVKNEEELRAHEKGNASMKRFLKDFFPAVFKANQKSDLFIKVIPLHWLPHCPVGCDPAKLTKRAQHFKSQGNWLLAFKLNFLILNELNWDDQKWANEYLESLHSLASENIYSANIDFIINNHIPTQELLNKVRRNVQSA
ncbi:MAG: hypothetical protein HRT44_11145, partial [Bdellovibrionales bacterium]|nr:hypothetical protein [Bdellovibrionales bacterium]NQZ19796.1 hypothetical protein [Bdellovibrionales bacterium]